MSRFSKKEKKQKQPKMKELSKRQANIMVYGLLALFVLIGFLGSLRAISLSSQVETLKDKVTVFESKQQDDSRQVKTLDVAKVQYYIANFIYTYINYDKDQMEERKAKLQKYYAFNSNSYEDELETNRTLKSQRVISIEESNDYDLAIVKVGYEINNESYTSNLAIPFVIKDGLLSIVSPPYYLGDNLYQGQADSFDKKSSEDLIKLSADETESIKEFLKVFFDKYASSNETDLKLVMRDPILMGVGYQVDKIDDSTALFYEVEDGKKVVQVSVVFKDNNNNKHTENFTLYLTQSENGWYVDELYNYFKN